MVYIQLGLEFMENPDCHRMDYNSHNGQHRHRHHHHSRNESFSSALLDAICMSTEDEGGMMAYKKNNNREETRNVEAENNSITRNSSYKSVVRIERLWDEDRCLNNDKFMRGRSAKMGVFNAERNETEAAYCKHRELHASFQSNMPSAALCSDYTSDSTSSCPYLSSDAESLYRNTSIPNAKTERGSRHVGREDRTRKSAVGREWFRDLHGKSSVRDGDFRSKEKPFILADHHANFKSKSQTRKDSQKPRKPTSPGRKLANFLNSLFIAGGTKKPKLSSSSSVSECNSYDSSEKKPTSTYSYSSSVQSRPCSSKTARGSRNRSGISQRSVTSLYPTSLIVDEDSDPCGEKCLHRMEKYPSSDPIPACDPHTYLSTDAYKLPLPNKELQFHILGEDWHAAAAAKDIIDKYKKANSIMESVVITGFDKQDEEEEEDDDDASFSSSDLFELENLAPIDMNMSLYQKELPVYETTQLETNTAIARGLIV